MCHKICFDSKGKAKRYIKKNKKKQLTRYSKGVKQTIQNQNKLRARNVYLCLECEKWHMTSQTKRDAKRYKC